MSDATNARPDARLLVPATPGLPLGARVWTHSENYGTVAGRSGQGALVAFWTGEALWYAFDALSLDLSAPALRDGVPERLDALPWALGLLDPDGASVVMGDMPGRAYIQRRSMYGPSTLIMAGTEWSPHPRQIRLATWPDLSNLNADDASRAVVAAALRTRTQRTL